MVTDEIPLRSYHNDYEFQANFYGEPFLDDGVLWYFDGEVLFVTGYDIDLKPIDRSRFLNIMACAEDRFQIDRVMLDAHSCLSIKRRYPSFRREILSRPRNYDGELFVTPQSYRTSQSRAALIRRAHRAGLECKLSGETGCLTVEQWSLVAAHIDQFEPSPYYHAEYVAAVVNLLQHRNSVLFEARREGTLVGFALAKARHPYAVFQLLFAAPDIRHVADLIYHSIITHFLDAGFRQISLGTGCTPGIKAFKEKWTTMPITPGLYDLYWEREDAGRIGDRLWFGRLLAKLH